MNSNCEHKGINVLNVFALFIDYRNIYTSPILLRGGRKLTTRINATKCKLCWVGYVFYVLTEYMGVRPLYFPYTN